VLVVEQPCDEVVGVYGITKGGAGVYWRLPLPLTIDVALRVLDGSTKLPK